ncbi:hypothetical protein TcasGA2_TC010673 [Tribolium castaneum]|uniref:Uncharacterized protein n=1 Tax=Tribolium castaneum TaxID=7070 RepID=D6X2K7_TRICA|nr:hypothetical protein TcasGA2_TC010673 [Tribolium castaneum]
MRQTHLKPERPNHDENDILIKFHSPRVINLMKNPLSIAPQKPNIYSNFVFTVNWTRIVDVLISGCQIEFAKRKVIAMLSRRLSER